MFSKYPLYFIIAFVFFGTVLLLRYTWRNECAYRKSVREEIRRFVQENFPHETSSVSMHACIRDGDLLLKWTAGICQPRDFPIPAWAWRYIETGTGQQLPTHSTVCEDESVGQFTVKHGLGHLDFSRTDGSPYCMVQLKLPSA